MPVATIPRQVKNPSFAIFDLLLNSSGIENNEQPASVVAAAAAIVKIPALKKAVGRVLTNMNSRNNDGR